MRQTLLISVAALALAAASTTASLAQRQQGAPGASGMSAPAGTNAPAANPSGANGPSTGMPGAAESQPSERPEPKGPAANRGAQDRTIPEKQQKSTQQTPRKDEKGEQPTPKQDQATPERGTKQGENTKQRENAKQGGPSAGTATNERAMTSKNVSLTSEQKTKVRSAMLVGSAPRVTNVNFDIKVGVVVPRTVRVTPVPATIVEIEPEWRGFMYFVRGEEIIIVDPRSLEIVAVVEV
jgi:uncharacterized protein DUF1236